MKAFAAKFMWFSIGFFAGIVLWAAKTIRDLDRLKAMHDKMMADYKEETDERFRQLRRDLREAGYDDVADPDEGMHPNQFH